MMISTQFGVRPRSGSNVKDAFGALPMDIHAPDLPLHMQQEAIALCLEQGFKPTEVAKQLGYSSGRDVELVRHSDCTPFTPPSHQADFGLAEEVAN